MWLFPGLSIVVIAAIVAVLIQMGLNPEVRTQLILSLLAWAVLVIIYFATKRLRDRAPAEEPAATPTGDAHRVLVLANETVEGHELMEELPRHRPRRQRRVPRLRAGQSDRYRPGHARGRGLSVGQDDRGRPGAAGSDAGAAPRREAERPRRARRVSPAPCAGRCRGSPPTAS